MKEDHTKDTPAGEAEGHQKGCASEYLVGGQQATCDCGYEKDGEANSEAQIRELAEAWLENEMDNGCALCCCSDDAITGYIAGHQSAAKKYKPLVGEQQRKEAESRVLALRGSYDAPGFDACVDAELKGKV